MKKTPGYITLHKEEIDLLERVKPQALAIYIHLRKRMNHKNQLFMSFPSQSKLAEEIGYSPKSVESVRKYAEELEKNGLIRIEKSRNPDTRVWNSNKYYFKVLEDLNNEASNPVAQKQAIASPDVLGYTSDNVNNYKEVNQRKASEDFASVAKATAQSSLAIESNDYQDNTLSTASETKVSSSSEQDYNNPPSIASEDVPKSTSSDARSGIKKNQSTKSKAESPPSYISLAPNIAELNKQIEEMSRQKVIVPSLDDLE